MLLAALDDKALEAYLATAQLRKLTPFTVSSRTALARTLKQVRSDGYCTLISELVDGFAGISVPVRAESGKVVAGLGFSMVLGSRDAAHLEQHYLPALRHAAGEIEALLRRR